MMVRLIKKVIFKCLLVSLFLVSAVFSFTELSRNELSRTLSNYLKELHINDKSIEMIVKVSNEK